MYNKTVSVYGLGQVGYPLATLFGSLNLKVYAIDKPNIINNLINKNKKILLTSINNINLAVTDSSYSFILYQPKVKMIHLIFQ